ncbi:aminotransferase class IV [soil metagenome]
MLVYLDGTYLRRGEARVSVDDRGFIFGDGVYEVIRASGGCLFTADEHLARLERGMRGIGIPMHADCARDRLLAIAEHLLRENGLLEGEATVYVQVTRGCAPRTHHFPAPECAPTVYLSAARFTPPVQIRVVGASAITHPDIRWSRCDLKTLNLLPNVLAKQRAVEAGATEAILVRDGVVTEGASTNVFGMVGGELRTYPVANYILAGITRGVVIHLAAELGITVAERPILAEELPHVEELFITGTTTDVLPVVQLDGRPIGDGRPGPITNALGEALARRMGMGLLAHRA